MIKLTRITYTQEVSQANHSDKKKSLSKEGDQVAYLKRLLVTLKQQYEKNLCSLNERLQNEMAQKGSIQEQLIQNNHASQKIQKNHEEELAAIKQQQVILRDLLKKSHDELKQLRVSSSSSDQVANQQRIDQMERMVPYWKERAEEANNEAEKLTQELERAQNKIVYLQSELSDAQHSYERQVQDPSSQQDKESSEQRYLSHSIKQELEEIKKIISLESRSLEKKYTDVLNDKIILENQLKDLQKQLEYQSNNLMSFKEQLHSSDQHKREIEQTLKDQAETIQKQLSYQSEMEEKAKLVHLISEQKIDMEEKYEQLRDDWKTLSYQLNESIDSRVYTEEYLSNMTLLAKEQEMTIEEQNTQLIRLIQEKDEVYDELNHIRHLFEESEEQLIAAQQHLAKKVKEATFLNEQIIEVQSSYNDCQLQLDSSRVQIGHLQTNVDLYQKQEKKLQDQLHEALKMTENQVSKWEEKYFAMYDKWQEAETRIKDLQKLEEKHQQLQSVLSNLGSFMGTSLTSSPLFKEAQETMEKSLRPHYLDMSEGKDFVSEKVVKPDSSIGERYDLFGMKYPQDNV